MSIIDRYIARTFFSGYVILLLVGIGVYILSEMLINVDEFIEDTTLPADEIVRRMLDYYLNNLPLYFSQLGGPVMTIAAAFTLGQMLRNNELTALLAAGMPLQRLAVPLLLCSVLTVGLWMVNREVVMPLLAHKISRTHADVIAARPAAVYCARDDRNAILTAVRMNTQTGELFRVFVFEPDDSGRPQTLVEADAARYDPQTRDWRLTRGRRVVQAQPDRQRGLEEAVRYEPVERLNFSLTPEQLVLRRESQWADLLSLRQLNELLRSRNVPNRPAIDMSRHARFTQPFLQWLLLLLAIPCFLSREPQHVLGAGGRALALTGSFFLVAFVAQNVSGDATLNAVAAWTPIFFFAPVAVLQLTNVRT